MGNIIVLDELTACKIAAGEVIERPASVVKEMVENSIDAGATSIEIEIKAGGIKYIRITDNGSGFAADDAEIAFEKHATSKIRNADDLEDVATLGFRGEALASIAAVADVELTSRTKENTEGIFVHIKGGRVHESGARGCPKGTTLIVRDLFFNTPARYKFLKKDSSEAGYVLDAIQHIALAHPEVSFKVISSGIKMLHTPGNNDLLSCIFSIYGRSIVDSLKPLNYMDNNVTITGYVGVGDAIFGTRSRQSFFVNGRFIKSKIITSALDEAYKTITMKGKYPFAVISINMPPRFVDVNVHPAKTEVRFANETNVFQMIYNSINNTLIGDTQKEPMLIKESSPSIYRESFETNEKAENKPEVKIPIVSGQITASTPVITPYIPTQITPVYKEFVQAEPIKFENISVGDALSDEKRIYNEALIIGQILNTYIILEFEQSMVLIDQHAAHERIMYEKIKNILADGNSITQMLFMPETVNLATNEYIMIKDNLEFFEKLGFEIEDFGGNCFIVRAVPAVLADANIENFITDAVSKLERKISLYADETIYSMACKAAIKANKPLSHEEMKEILHDLSVLTNNATCPHGRPIIVQLTKTEIEKKFKRIL